MTIYLPKEEKDTHHTFNTSIKGWAGAGFNRKDTEIKIRKVRRLDGCITYKDEIQLEISIGELKGKRYFKTCTSFSFPEELIPVLKSIINQEGN